MPGIEIFGNKLLLFLGGLVIYIILLTISIVCVRKIYWDTSKLSKRQKRIREIEKPGIVLIFVCAAAGTMTLLLALTVDLVFAMIFAAASAFVILLVYSASGRGGDKGTPGDLPSGYLGG